MLTEQLNHEVLSKSSICVKKAKEVIALEKENYEQGDYIKGLINQNHNLSEGYEMVVSLNKKYLKKIKKLKNKVKWLSLR